MKKWVTKILVWTLSCGLILVVILLGVKKSFAAQAMPDTCQTKLPATESIQPLWESISHQFVAAVALY